MCLSQGPALTALKGYTEGLTTSGLIERSDTPAVRVELEHLISKCKLRLGRWRRELHGLNEETIPVILKDLEECTKFDGNWYKAWHAWSMINFDCVNFYNGRIHSQREEFNQRNQQNRQRHLSSASASSQPFNDDDEDQHQPSSSSTSAAAADQQQRSEEEMEQQISVSFCFFFQLNKKRSDRF